MGSEPTSGGDFGQLVRRLAQDQRVVYLLVGGINTVIGLAWFYVLHLAFGDAFGYMGTLVGAYGFGMITGFMMQRRFVFKVVGPVMIDFLRFAVVTAVTFGLNALLLPLFVEIVGVPVFPAQIVSIALTVVLSYFAHRSFSFRRVPANAQSEGFPL